MNEDQKAIEEVLPHAKNNELIIALTEALGNSKNMRVIAKSEAGIKLSKELWIKIFDLIDKIRKEYQTCPEQELRAICAAIDTQMELYKQLSDSGFIVDMAQKELDEAVKELAKEEG